MDVIERGSADEVIGVVAKYPPRGVVHICKHAGLIEQDDLVLGVIKQNAQ
ncbi:MAG: hypothetical protein J07HN6_01939 [Halonotius sp. J07HN6]|nr:MAG: hypothetical protein J07HN6_01939 [Halonotius sp. J07HN6]